MDVDDDADDVTWWIGLDDGGYCRQPPCIRDDKAADRVVGRATNAAVVIFDVM